MAALTAATAPSPAVPPPGSRPRGAPSLSWPALSLARRRLGVRGRSRQPLQQPPRQAAGAPLSRPRQHGWCRPTGAAPWRGRSPPKGQRPRGARQKRGKRRATATRLSANTTGTTPRRRQQLPLPAPKTLTPRRLNLRGPQGGAWRPARRHQREEKERRTAQREKATEKEGTKRKGPEEEEVGSETVWFGHLEPTLGL